jgi:hypothetical protein
MVKKILLGLLGAFLVGLLVFGAVNRTMALVNHPDAGHHYGQQDTDLRVERGWAADQGLGQKTSRHGHGQGIAEGGPPDGGFGQMHRGQGRGAGHPWDGDAKSSAPWN